MAVYKVKQARALLPVHYFEAGGALADHTADENLVAVNERGVQKEIYQPVSQGAVFYTDAASHEAAKEEAGEGGSVYYVTNEAYVESHVNLGTFEKVEQKKQQSASSQESKPRGRQKAAQQQDS